ncbi:MAG: EI24 domain-containing protein [Paenirhodobacter sp.]|uniref:EI24 domain-containing protein n=1 Tax=Paenirhodobacter sp. TaxID=1965326 RepID=UPI003D140920
MILTSYLRGWGDLMRPGAMKILAIGVALALGLFVALFLALTGLADLLLPDTITLPWIGPVSFLHAAAGWASFGLMLVASIFLMVPVASAFTGFFLEDVAEMVEAEHYPTLPKVRPMGFVEGLGDTMRFFGVVLGANLIALIIYPFVIPFAPLLFFGLNGYLLGREYFQMAAFRRMDKPQAMAFYQRNKLTVWAAGALMAVPLAVPLLNLVVPVVGAAAFTHLFHALARRDYSDSAR